MSWKSESRKTTNIQFVRQLRKMCMSHIDSMEKISLNDDEELEEDVYALISWLRTRSGEQFKGYMCRVWHDDGDEEERGQ